MPEGPDAWRELLDAVEEVLAAHELGGLILLHESSLYRADAAWQEDLLEQFRTTDPEQYWEWTADSACDGTL
ncbi:hypothetical protein [Nesterenkonia sp. CF4.4]|uniref:hypothetical protein n=1 Tax=Nesterenkonia sp. CF4.4 TaxID=3373079 RepID=UPI003EE4E9C1